MIYEVHVIPKAKKQSVEIEGNKLKVKIHALPEKGKANQEVINLLSKYFKVSKSKIKILKGQTSKNKQIEVDL